MAGSSKVLILGEKEGVRAKAKFWCKLNPGAFFIFLPAYSSHNVTWKVPDILGTISEKFGTLQI